MKKIISICLMLCLFVTIGSVFVGCGKNYSADDISVYYNQITQTNEETKQFFVANQLKVDFKTNNESVKTSFDDQTSPAYILNIVYEPMATASMKFLSAKIDISNIKALTNDMTQEARNNIYVNLQNLDASLQEFAKIKGIYERSDGTLQFTKLLTAYNKVIDSSFALNFEFADNYYLNTKGIGYKDFSVEDLTITDTDIKDMMYYNNMILAKIVFDFSVKTYEPSNPLTSIDNWYNTETYMTTYLHNYLTLAKKINSVSGKQLASTLYQANPDEIETRLYQLQVTNESFLTNRDLFYNGTKNFNFSKYYNQTNQSIYLKNCSEKEQSYFNISKNFLDDRFVPRINTLTAFYNNYIALCN